MPGTVDRLLVVGPSWVGDMVMAKSLFMNLKAQSPERVLDVLAPAWSEPLLARMPQVSAALTLPFGHGQLALAGRRELGKRLRGAGYGQAIVLPNSLKSALVPWFANIPRRTGWRGMATTAFKAGIREIMHIPATCDRGIGCGRHSVGSDCGNR